MENNMHRPRYSLPPQAIVGGRYLVREFLEEQENQIIYLATDLVEKKQVRLAECYPKALVQRKGEAGEEDVIIRPRREPKVEEIQRQFEKKYKQVIRDHHTVYAVLPLKNKKKPMGAIALCMAVIVLGAGMLAAIFFSAENESPTGQQYAEKTQETAKFAVSETDFEFSGETITYDNGDYIYKAGEDTIQMDSDSGVIYFDRILQVYLESELTDEQINELIAAVDGKLVGKIAGRMNILQVRIPESGFDALEEAAQKLMEQENVLFSGYDYPVHIENTMAGQDTNPWSEAAGEDGKTYNEDEPSGNNWWAEAIGAYTAWNNLPEKIDNGIVGIIDNEFDVNHPDLKGKIRIIGNEENSKISHGTHVAGIAGAMNNNIGIRGIADSAQIIAKVYADWYDYETVLLRVADNKLLIDNGAKVVNNSWGVYLYSQQRYEELADKNENIGIILYKKAAGEANHDTSYDGYLQYYLNVLAVRTSQDTERMIEQMLDSASTEEEKRFMFVQSAGNGFNNEGQVRYDASVGGFFCGVTEKNHISAKYSYEEIKSHIMVVSAVKNQKERGIYQIVEGFNQGDTVDIWAPGWNIYSCISADDEETNKGENKVLYKEKSGTSMAAPMVAASALLLWEIQPSLSAGEVKQILLENASEAYDPLDNSIHPMLNIGKAVLAVQGKAQEDDIWQKYLKNTLIQQYGIMSTDSWKLDNSLPTWSKGDDSPADGILSALIEDFDRDGDDELLVVRFEKEDNKKLYLEVFENYDGAVELATGAQFDIDWLCRTCQNNRFSVFAEKKDGMCRIYLYAFQRGNGGGDESLVQLEYEQVMMPQITLENYWSFRMGSDGTASVQSGTLKLNEINQAVGLWDYGQGTDQAEADYEETAGAPYESDSYPEAFIGMLEDFYGNLEETTGLVHKTELPQYLGDDSIGIYVSADDVYSGEMLYTAKNLFEEDSNTIWIASLDNHMYHDLSSNTIENTMIPQDYTGIVR